MLTLVRYKKIGAYILFQNIIIVLFLGKNKENKNETLENLSHLTNVVLTQ